MCSRFSNGHFSWMFEYVTVISYPLPTQKDRRKPLWKYIFYLQSKITIGFVRGIDGKKYPRKHFGPSKPRNICSKWFSRKNSFKRIHFALRNYIESHEQNTFLDLFKRIFTFSNGMHYLSWIFLMNWIFSVSFPCQENPTLLLRVREKTQLFLTLNEMTDWKKLYELEQFIHWSTVTKSGPFILKLVE